MEDYFEMMRAEQEAMEKEWFEAKESIRDIIEEKYFIFAEEHDTYSHVGIVDIYEVVEKQWGYGNNQKNCRVEDEEHSKLYMLTTGEIYDEEQEAEISLYYWVWQTTGYCGDDYSGFLLFPLMNGKFWKIAYSC